MLEADVAVIGGGPAGLAAALSAREKGAGKVLIIERDRELGGILNQCIHNGFGLHYFGEELTGPEYAGRFTEKIPDSGIEVMLDTMALSVTPEKLIYASGPQGYRMIKAKAAVLAMGCRERSRGAVAIPGDRPSGIFTAGTAQRYVNMEGFMVGRRAVILGSGDIGLIMARRLTLEGAKVLACVEIMPYSGGLARNIAQCLDDFGIPLYLSHTITSIRGDRRVQGVTVSKVDENRTPVPGTEMEFDCDTVLLSVGLIPENELTRGMGAQLDERRSAPVVYENCETSVPGVFACGNALQVHDLVDFVTAESIRAGAAAAEYALNGERELRSVRVCPGRNISYVVPQRIRPENAGKITEIFFRVGGIHTDMEIRISAGGKKLASFRRAHMAPGEMEKVALTKQALLAAGENDIILEVVKEGEQ